MSSEDTVVDRKGMLELVLDELREFKSEQSTLMRALFDNLELVKNELARQGSTIAGLESSCSKRLSICSARDRSNGSSSSGSWTPEEVEELAP